MALNPHSLSILLILLFTRFRSSLSSVEHIDPTLPPLLPNQPPCCSLFVLKRDFTNFTGTARASSNYTQPLGCPFPWSRVVLELSASAWGLPRSHIAAVWINGAEILRTSGPGPKAQAPAYWKVEKDVTHYASLLQCPNSSVVTMMVENSNEAEIGVYSTNVSLHFYRGLMDQGTYGLSVPAHPSIKRLYDEPADLIIPISDVSECYGPRSWFRIENGSHVVGSTVKLPMNSYRAVMEIFLSYHGEDENWYINPLRSSSSSSSSSSNGGLRHLSATIDGRFIGGVIPFMVIYPGSINPFFWSPVSSIASFNMPTYDLDLTPFLSILVDGDNHKFELGIHQARSHWLVSANLHVWIDPLSDSCQAGLTQYIAPVPPFKITRKAKLDGESVINADGMIKFVGWVSSSKGNLTTRVSYKINFTSQVQVQYHGSLRRVQVDNGARALVEVAKGDQLIGWVQLSREAPLQVVTSSVRVVGGALFEKTRLSHKLKEMIVYLSRTTRGNMTTLNELMNEQDAEGTAWMKDGEAVFGNGATRLQYKYRDTDTCYVREVSTVGGILKEDSISRSASC